MSAQPAEPVWTIRHEVSAAVRDGGPATFTAVQTRALLARLDELEDMEQRARTARGIHWGSARHAVDYVLNDES